MKIIIRGPILNASSHCGPILRSLPEWFGIEEATAQYIRDTDKLPTFLAFEGDVAVGFLTFKQHSDFTAEILVMGVPAPMHRRGIGHALVEKAVDMLQQQGVEYLQVKTLSPSHPDKNYAKTREFYLASGFRPLEEFMDLWGEENPCLQLIMYIGSAAVGAGESLLKLSTK